MTVPGRISNRQRVIRVTVLTAIFSAYLGLAAYIVAIEPVRAGIGSLLAAVAIPTVFYGVYWSYWDSDIGQYGSPDIVVRLTCYFYSIFFTVGVLVTLTLCSVTV